MDGNRVSMAIYYGLLALAALGFIYLGWLVLSTISDPIQWLIIAPVGHLPALVAPRQLAEGRAKVEQAADEVKKEMKKTD